MVIMKWNPYLEQWFMYDDRMKEMYRFFDCGNINRLYLRLDKTKLNYYPQVPLEPIEHKEIT